MALSALDALQGDTALPISYAVDFGAALTCTFALEWVLRGWPDPGVYKRILSTCMVMMVLIDTVALDDVRVAAATACGYVYADLWLHIDQRTLTLDNGVHHVVTLLLILAGMLEGRAGGIITNVLARPLLMMESTTPLLHTLWILNRQYPALPQMHPWFWRLATTLLFALWIVYRIYPSFSLLLQLAFSPTPLPVAALIVVPSLAFLNTYWSLLLVRKVIRQADGTPPYLR